MNIQKKILIADGDKVNLDFFEVMFSKLGFEVAKAADGMEALEEVKRFAPDLILTDNLMPRLSGWELTRILKNDPKYRQIPIVMLSQVDGVTDKVEAFELGVDDYITKPFNFSEVLARIRAVLRGRELFSQIVIRDSRLSLAEELSNDMKRNMETFVQSLDELDQVIAGVSGEQNPPSGDELRELLGLIGGKTRNVRKRIAELDARIEKTIAKWDDLKKNEIRLPVLENRLRKSME